MKYVLVPTKLAEKITLNEALFWIGFNAYFTAEHSEDYNDLREDSEYQEDLTITEPLSLDLFFTEQVCEKYGLPKSYLPEYFEENGDYPYDPYIGWKNFSEHESTLPPEYVEKLKNDKKDYDDFLLKQNVFDEALEDYLEIPKSRLFIELKKGNVQAFGREILQSLTIKDSYEDDELAKLYSSETNDLFAAHEEIPELEPIPTKEWIQKNIDWEDGCLRGDASCYCHILIDIESLFSCFPEPIADVSNVYSVNGTLLLDEDAPQIHARATKGRPAYNWKEFNEEMIRRFSKGNLPELQKSCIIDMQQWCAENWDKIPSETNLKEHISPFYKVKRESENKSESKSEKQFITS